ncbi:hypothetical protein OUZ56_025237 [Daphnia magna]|uniref:Uncharacterized protein n=1 Tax=Daphnia magna TaxID=35525 RepID=A0ABQ9ZJ93_9CRUS|nr:hypothetical protein OUZ56_025237 [Daphnia magna]
MLNEIFALFHQLIVAHKPKGKVVWSCALLCSSLSERDKVSTPSQEDESYGPASLRIYKRSNNKMITATLDSLKHLSPLKSVNLVDVAN